MSETKQLARRHSSISHDPVEELPNDLQELYAQVGIASEIAQVLELEAGNLALAYIAMFVDPAKVTSEETEVFRALIDDVNRKTLGAMFKHIRKMATIDKELLDIMDKALDKRNYLMHRYFRAHNFAIQSQAGRKAMHEDMNDIIKDLRRGLDVMSAMTNSVNHLAGNQGDLDSIAEGFVQHGRCIDL